MPAVPYIHFGGNCREAMEAYARILKGTLELMTYADAPPDAGLTPTTDLVMHSALTLPDGAQIFAADAPPHMYVKPQGFAVSVHPADTAEAAQIFDALAEGGTVVMPLDKTFWAQAFGMVNDKYGINWMVNVA